MRDPRQVAHIGKARFLAFTALLTIGCMSVSMSHAQPTSTDHNHASRNHELERLWNDACQALHGVGTAPTQHTTDEKRAWRDKLVAAVPMNPSSELEASIVLEAGRASQSIGDTKTCRSLLRQVAETPHAGPSNRMMAIQLLLGYSVLQESPTDVVQALNWYSEAARERMREPDPIRRQGYLMERDPLIRAAAYYRGRAFFEAAMLLSTEAPQRREYAIRAVQEFDAHLQAAFEVDGRSDFPATKRQVLYAKGLAHAIISDGQAVLRTADAMSRAPVVKADDLQEAVGYFLFRAADIIANGSDSTGLPWTRSEKRRELFREYERHVPPDDPYFVEFQKSLAFADGDDLNWESCVARTDQLLGASDPRVRAYLEAHPSTWGGLWYLKADGLQKLGRRDEAVAALREFVLRFPDNPNTSVARTRLEEGW